MSTQLLPTEAFDLNEASLLKHQVATLKRVAWDSWSIKMKPVAVADRGQPKIAATWPSRS